MCFSFVVSAFSVSTSFCLFLNFGKLCKSVGHCTNTLRKKTRIVSDVAEFHNFYAGYFEDYENIPDLNRFLGNFPGLSRDCHGFTPNLVDISSFTYMISLMYLKPGPFTGSCSTYL